MDAQRWSFGEVVVDARSLELRVKGQRVEIDRKPFQVLLFLLRNAGAAVRKDQLAQACWPGRILSDSVLDKTLSRVREALGEAGSAVETVRGVGWRLAAPVRVEAGAVAATATLAGNLPASLTPLVGREQALASAHERLGRADARLLTLTGCGGIGKTRMSLALGARMAADFPDGVWFVDLAPLRSAELLIPAIAQVLAVRETGQQPLLQGLGNHLRDKRALLVLDNFEQIMAAAPVLAELLRACPGVKAIVTSREHLHLRGECELEVPSLALPAAVELFAERARMVKPDFAVDAACADDVAEICRRLDGVPLAIELAAARARQFTPRARRERLDRRFELLRDGPRDLPPRQQALWATVDWSHELLEPNEQCLLRRLAVFAGGFTLAAAQAVCAGGPVAAGEVFALLARLVDKSLVRYEDQGVAGRYRMLETFREYAAGRLVQAGELDAAHRRHLDHLLGLAREADAHVGFFMSDPRMAQWMPRFAAEHDNLRAVLRWGAGSPEAAPDALRLAGMLHWFWFSAGHITESVARLRELLERAAHAPDALRAPALVAAANLAIEQGGSDAVREDLLAYARASLDWSLAEFRRQGDRSWTAYVLSSLAALVVTAGGDAGEAQGYVVEGLALAREADDRWLVSYLTHFLGRAAWFGGDLDASAAAFTESIRATRDMGGNQIGEAYGTYWLARIARAQGDLAAARTRHLEALQLFEDAGNLQGLAVTLAGLGGIAARSGEPRRAFTLLAAVSHWRAQLRAFLEPDVDAEHAADWALARAALEPAACAALTATAAAMDAAQASACARADGA